MPAGEREIIDSLIQSLSLQPAAGCVDLGASSGPIESNTSQLFHAGWPGLAVECDSDKFRRLSLAHGHLPVRLSSARITPANVCATLAAAQIAPDFGVLSLDIDGYDYFVLDSMLQHYRPRIICAEINEKIPPPVCFTVLYSDDHCWDTSHLFGCSLSQYAHLASTHRYSLIHLEFNNIFMIPAELTSDRLRPISAAQAYDQGYRERGNRCGLFPWNSDVDHWLELQPAAALAAIQEHFSSYAGKFYLGLEPLAG